jgi:drug/metabolite transporter (DMT)-like permease
MPPGLASVTQQTQAFFTIALAAAFLRDRPTRRQIVSMDIAFAGLALVATTAGGDIPVVALVLAIAAALSGAMGNVLVERDRPRADAAADGMAQPGAAASGAACLGAAPWAIAHRGAAARFLGESRRTSLSRLHRHNTRLRELGQPARALSRRERRNILAAGVLRRHFPLPS